MVQPVVQAQDNLYQFGQLMEDISLTSAEVRMRGNPTLQTLHWLLLRSYSTSTENIGSHVYETLPQVVADL